MSTTRARRIVASGSARHRSVTPLSAPEASGVSRGSIWRHCALKQHLIPRGRRFGRQRLIPRGRRFGHQRPIHRAKRHRGNCTPSDITLDSVNLATSAASDVLPFTKAAPRNASYRGRKRGMCRILTDTPVKNEIEAAYIC